MKKKEKKGIGCATVFILLPIPAMIIYGLVSKNFDFLHGLIYGGVISLVFLICTVISAVKKKEELRRLEKVEAFRAANAAKYGGMQNSAASDESTQTENKSVVTPNATVSDVSTQTENKSVAPVRKNKSKGKLAVLVILLVAVIGAVGFFGFREGGWFRNDGKNYDAQSMQSLYDYAKQLEKAGNSEAAEAVYEIIAQGGGAELIEKAHEDIPVIKHVDELEHLREIFGNRKGGGTDE